MSKSKRTIAVQKKSDGELLAIIKAGGLSAAAAQYEYTRRNGAKSSSK